MCGICGFVLTNPDQPADPEMLPRMTRILCHRGPDSEGFYTRDGIRLGVRRLSIIDIEGGDQPISNEDDTVTIICNGEIYNYVELRQQLLSAGHRFRTRSDIEVIVHLYEDHAIEFVHFLRGMFALALWDAKRRMLILVRDRLGIKPLYYAQGPDALYFASEMKSIFASGRVDPDLDIHSLKDLFTYGFVLAPKTLSRGICRLPAGHYLTHQNGSVAVKKYWDVTFPQQDHYDLHMSCDEWAEGLREKLTESIRIHLRSDVPVGVWLSGGLDSSAVAELMLQITNRKVEVFTLRFEDPAFDEFAGQQTLDTAFPNSFTVRKAMCRNRDFQLLPKALWHCEDPFMAGVQVTGMILSKLSSGRVKVILTGEGSDEIFGGYSWYWADKLLRPLSKLPLWSRRRMSALPFIRKKWPGASGLMLAPREMNLFRYAHLVGPAGAIRLQDELFSKDLREWLFRNPSEHGPALPDSFSRWHPFAQLQYHDLKRRLPDCIVQQLDRSSMAYSVEARVPFLDHELVEFCTRIPPSLKMKGSQEKYILRRSMKGLLPPQILQRRKRALSAPIQEWFREDLPDFAEDLLSKERLRRNGYFDPECITRMLNQHRNGQEDHGRLLLGVLGIQLWDDLFVKDRRVNQEKTSALSLD